MLDNTTPWSTDRRYGLLILDRDGLPVAVGLNPEVAASIVAVVNKRFAKEARD